MTTLSAYSSSAACGQGAECVGSKGIWNIGVSVNMSSLASISTWAPSSLAVSGLLDNSAKNICEQVFLHLRMKASLRTCPIFLRVAFVPPILVLQSSHRTDCLTSFLSVLSDDAEATTTMATVAATKRANLVMLLLEMFSLKSSLFVVA